ncbi:MAG: pyruvate kinase [Clostridia bacterium]|nr:pyruvate kinase [Clostridia bacterium]
MRKTKIVATIGPSSEKPEMLEQLIKAGINVMRLNFSHGDHEEHLAKVKTLRELNKKLGTNVAFLLDTKGPEIRTGVFEDGKKHEFKKGNKVTITSDYSVPCTDDTICVSYPDLTKDVVVGGHILMCDALLDFIIDKIDGNKLECTVQNTGLLGNKKNVNVPGAKLNLSALTEKDIADVKFAVENDFDYISASFIRKPEDVLEMRKLLNEIGGEKIKIISKIENQEGLDNFDEILKVSDGIMIARGDLGSEIDIAELPAVQKMMIKKTVAAGKPVITATQMLDSMERNPRPTRAEVSDVANAVYDGTSAVMLSGESAQGNYPLESVTMMARIASHSEKNIDYWKRFKKKNIEKLTSFEKIDLSDKRDFKKQVNFAVSCSAMFSNADAIIAVSENGCTPSILSSFKPACPIYVITANEKTCRQMSLEFNVTAIHIPGIYDFDKILKAGIDNLKSKGLLKSGDTVILSGGFPQENPENYLKGEATGAIIKI